MPSNTPIQKILQKLDALKGNFLPLYCLLAEGNKRKSRINQNSFRFHILELCPLFGSGRGRLLARFSKWRTVIPLKGKSILPILITNDYRE